MAAIMFAPAANLALANGDPVDDETIRFLRTLPRNAIPAIDNTVETLRQNDVLSTVAMREYGENLKRGGAMPHLNPIQPAPPALPVVHLAAGVSAGVSAMCKRVVSFKTEGNAEYAPLLARHKAINCPEREKIKNLADKVEAHSAHTIGIKDFCKGNATAAFRRVQVAMPCVECHPRFETVDEQDPSRPSAP
jgi:hypothetical protein